MAQILQIADRKNAGATILLELLEEVGRVDARDQSSLVRKRPRYVRKSQPPSPEKKRTKCRTSAFGL
jgi:hypothetical protein